MQIRLGIDITWTDMLYACLWCIWPFNHWNRLQQAAIRAWSDDQQCLATFSVRTAFDAALRAMQLPNGSEILISALNIPDMLQIIEANGLRPVIVDVDADGRIQIDALRGAITERSRAMLVAHLYGGQLDLHEVAEVLRPYNILLIEDNAQGFDKVGEQGLPESAIVLHSFGAIKTASALGGGVARVRSAELRDEMRLILESAPRQSHAAYLKQVLRFAKLKLLAGRIGSRLLRCVANRWRGGDMDRLIASTQAFSDADLIQQIRQQPSAPLLRLLMRRWRHHEAKRLEPRRQRGELLRAALDSNERQDGFCSHNHWVFPVFVDDRAQVKAALWDAGYDATWKCRMGVLATSKESRSPDAPTAAAAWQRLLFLPWNERITKGDVERMADIVRASSQRA